MNLLQVGQSGQQPGQGEEIGDLYHAEPVVMLPGGWRKGEGEAEAASSLLGRPVPALPCHQPALPAGLRDTAAMGLGRFPGPLLRRTRGPDPSSKATLWVKAQHEGALPPPCIVRKDVLSPVQLFATPGL